MIDLLFAIQPFFIILFCLCLWRHEKAWGKYRRMRERAVLEERQFRRSRLRRKLYDGNRYVFEHRCWKRLRLEEVWRAYIWRTFFGLPTDHLLPMRVKYLLGKTTPQSATPVGHVSYLRKSNKVHVFHGERLVIRYLFESVDYIHIRYEGIGEDWMVSMYNVTLPRHACLRPKPWSTRLSGYLARTGYQRQEL